MPQKVGRVELHMGPDTVQGPDDLAGAIIRFIDGAERRLDIAVQELESLPIAKAIIRAKQRKVRVNVVLEHDYLRAKRARVDPFTPGGPNEPNRKIHDAMLRAKIDIKPDYNPGIFHQKFIVRDSGQPTAALLTGSTNFTPTGVGKNLNHLVIVRDQEVVRIYAREFREIKQGHFGRRNEGHDPKPKDVIVSNVPIRVCFAPDHQPEMEIMKQMLKAAKRVDFAIFTFAKSSGIDDTMFNLLARGLAVRGAFDARQGAQDWAAIPQLKKRGAKLFRVPKPGANGVGKLHHKLMVIDKEVVVAGSFNYTGPANNVNDENIIILGDLETSTAATRKAQKKLAAYALKEIDRIITDFGVPL